MDGLISKIEYLDKIKVKSNLCPEGTAFFALTHKKRPQITHAMRYFSEVYKIPIITDPNELPYLDHVLFSIISFRDAYLLANFYKYKGSGEWIAGGPGVSNPTALLAIMDYIFIGDCFYSFENILNGARDIEGLINCKKLNTVNYVEDTPLFRKPYSKKEIFLSRGCKRKCLFCINAWNQKYKEQNPEVIESFIRNSKSNSVSLCSNSSDDVSFYADVVRWLAKYNKTDSAVSNSVSGFKKVYIHNRKREIFFGIEGMTEDLRYIVNKPISREKLYSTVSYCLAKIPVRTVFQFNLPGETVASFFGILEFIKYIKDNNSFGLWTIPFIPNMPTAHTPLQWSPAYYNENMLYNIMDLRKKYIGNKLNNISLYIPMPLHPARWFLQMVAQWEPITPQISKIARKIKPGISLEECVNKFSSIINVDRIFNEKKSDFQFPWDIVKVQTEKNILFKAYIKMKDKINNV